MPDLLSHAFLAYTLCTLLAARYDWLSPQYVTVGMAGAFVPDIAKLDLIVDSTIVAVLLDTPFDWFGLHTLGGVLVSILVGVVLVSPEDRCRVFALLSVGAGSHLIADALLVKASGSASPLLWPVTLARPPTPGLYLSTDIWPSLVTGFLAVLTWWFVRRPAHAGT